MSITNELGQRVEPSPDWLQRQLKYDRLMRELSGYAPQDMPMSYRTSDLCLEHHKQAVKRIDEESMENAILKRCGCAFALIDEQPQWHTICDEHQRVLTLHTAIIRRNIAQGVLDER